jgi:hypothetical protein
LKHHKPTNQFCVSLDGRRVTLGSDESAARRRYQELCKQILDGPREAPTPDRGRNAGDPLTVSEALLRFMRDKALPCSADQPRAVARFWEMAEAVRREHADLDADRFRGHGSSASGLTC